MLEFQLDAINIAVIIIFVINFVYGVLVYSFDKKQSVNKLFFLITISTSLWGLTLLGYRGFSDETVVNLFARLLYASAATIPIVFIFFTSIFVNNQSLALKRSKLILLVISALVILFSIHKNGLITNVEILYGHENIISFNTFLHTIFLGYITSFFLISYLILFRSLKYKTGSQRKQVVVVLIGTLISTIIALVTNMLMPYLGHFSLNWMGQVGIVVMVSSIFYGMLKHRLFNAKIIATELFVFSLWIFMITRTLISKGVDEIVINSIVLIATIIIGILVIKSVLKEVHTRERIEKLAEELAGANARLRELDKQKSEFVSIASHQLRSPLTAMKGYSSMILEETFGKVPTKLLEPIKRIYESSERLVLIIEDFLNISRIEQGRMKYDFSTVDLEKIVNEVLEDLESSFKRKKLWFKLELIDKGPFNITADSGKVHQVVSNLIDNSIKYTPEGGVTISLRKDETSRKVLLTISDTGIGISPEIIPRLFQKFSRADDAGKENIQGTGLGLYVAKEIMKAHRGNIWVDSEGKGKGSTFHLEFMAE